jgi:cyclase
MLLPRLIPVLLITKDGVVKTQNFKNPKYIGDIINSVKIFNEKKVDELIILDIEASRLNTEPDYKLIEKIALEANMPICIGGGIKNNEQANRIFNLGVEKVCLSSILTENLGIVSEVSSNVGSQSVAAVLDVKKINNKYILFINNGEKKVDVDLKKFINSLQVNGIGEIIINSIDNDGQMNGYDFDLVKELNNEIKVPFTIIGGAGKLEDVKNLFKKYKYINFGCGSIFVFKGPRRSVLLNYPEQNQKISLFSD